MCDLSNFVLYSMVLDGADHRSYVKEGDVRCDTGGVDNMEPVSCKEQIMQDVMRQLWRTMYDENKTENSNEIQLGAMDGIKCYRCQKVGHNAKGANG